MIDFDISVTSPLLERDGDARAWRAGSPPPTIDIVLSGFTGGSGNGYSIRPQIDFYAAAVLDMAGSLRPYPCRVVVEELSPSFVKPDEQYALRATLRYPDVTSEDAEATIRFGWRQHGFLLVVDGRGNSRQLWLPEGRNGDFDRGNLVPGRGYTIEFKATGGSNEQA